MLVFFLFTFLNNGHEWFWSLVSYEGFDYGIFSVRFEAEMKGFDFMEGKLEGLTKLGSLVVLG